MVAGNLSNTIITGLHNPDCAFYVGTFIGQTFALRSVLLLICVYFLFRLVESLILGPIINYVKEKINHRIKWGTW